MNIWLLPRVSVEAPANSESSSNLAHAMSSSSGLSTQTHVVAKSSGYSSLAQAPANLTGSSALRDATTKRTGRKELNHDANITRAFFGYPKTGWSLAGMFMEQVSMVLHRGRLATGVGAWKVRERELGCIQVWEGGSPGSTLRYHTLIHVQFGHPIAKELHGDVPFAPASLVHLIREPVAMMISAYRYHVSKPESWELSNDPPECRDCDPEAYHAIFASCSYTCSYYERLKSLPEGEGVRLESLRQRWTRRAMLHNIQAWRSNHNVLHLSLAHFRRDFNATVRCILKLFSRSFEKPTRLLEVMKLLQHADVFREDRWRKSQHVTSGKFDNEELKKEVLSGDEGSNAAMLREDREAFHLLTQPIFERQKQMFGCPVP